MKLAIITVRIRKYNVKGIKIGYKIDREREREREKERERKKERERAWRQVFSVKILDVIFKF